MEEHIQLPEGVTATYVENVLTVKGPKGEVHRTINQPTLAIRVSGNTVLLHAERFTKREKKLMYTFRAHIKNMCKGVTEGHKYVLRICAGHFPMNVTIKGTTFEVKNFIGEKVPRVLQFSDKVTVKMDGKDITVEGIDKELTAQTAASIEQLTKRVGFDRRIFQDGIYLVEKDGKHLV